MSDEKVYLLHNLLSTARAPVSFARICETLHCSERTAHRVIEELRIGRGAPIVRTRDPHGYTYSDQAYQLPLPGLWFTHPQLYAFLLLQQILRSFPPGLLGDLMDSIRDRMQEIFDFLGLPPDTEDRIRLLKVAARPPGPCFNTVASAAIQRKRLLIRYDPRSKDGASDREVSPQRILYYRDRWYVDVWCHKQEKLRVFSIDRIKAATVLETAAMDIPKTVADEYFTGGYGIYAGPVVATAQLRFSSSSARWVAEEEWHPAQVGRWLDSGEYLLEIPYSNPEELIQDIMRHGAEVEVLAPADLRQAVAERHRAAASLYM